MSDYAQMCPGSGLGIKSDDALQPTLGRGCRDILLSQISRSSKDSRSEDVVIGATQGSAVFTPRPIMTIKGALFLYVVEISC